MTDYKTYLTQILLKDKQHVSYRLLSRAVKCHVNQAKEMLYEFYNSNKSSSVHATYLISGTMPVENKKAKDEDEMMVDSTPRFALEHESVNTARLGFIITSEDNLEATKSKFSTINAIHIYSLGPGAIKDEEPLETVRNTIRSQYGSGDPMGNLGDFGGVVCHSVKHQTGKLSRQHAAPTLVPIVSDKKIKADKQNAIPEKSSSSKDQKPAAAAEISTKAPAKPLPKRQQADFFKSFGGKKEPKKPIAKKEDTPAKDEEPSQMQVDSESEEDVPEPPPKRDAKKEAETLARKKKEQEDLAHMFDDLDEDDLKAEDIEMNDAPPTPAAKKEEEKEEEASPAKEESEPSPESSRPQSSHSDTKSTQQKVKKRGRRLVSKPVTRRGADGYLETTEEKVWESYSEDEVVAKPAPKKIAPASGAKKPAGRGQGNIMSFFGKK